MNNIIKEKFELHTIIWNNCIILYIENVLNKPGSLMQITDIMYKKGINIDIISQNYSDYKNTFISIIILEKDSQKLINNNIKLLIKEKMPQCDINILENYFKVSITGHGLSTCPEIANKIFKEIAKKHENIQMVSISENEVNLILQKSENAINLFSELNKKIINN